MKQKYLWFTVTQDDKIITHEQENPRFSLKELQEEIHGYVEVVAPMLFQYTPYREARILCDDDGMYKDELKPNMLASALYGGGSPILGDVVVCTTVAPITTEEPDIWPFTEYVGVNMKSFLEALMRDLKESFPDGVEWERV